MGVGKSTFAFTNTAITLDGGSTTINITRDNQSYSHKLSHGYGDIATLAVGTTSYTWKPTAAQLTKFFQEVPNQKTRQIDVYLDTYNGSTLVGRDVHAVTVTLSEATGKPTLSSFSINDDNTTTKGWGILVYGKSSITASQSVSAKHGATITKTVYTYGGNEYTSIVDLIGSLPLTTTPTNYTIGCKTVDSRGFATTASLTKSCAKYEAPTIDTLEMVRCDSSGNETEAGTKAKAIVKGSWASIGGKNTATFKIGYKLQNGTSYTYQTIAVTGGAVNIEQILSVTLTADSDYLFAVSLVDGAGDSFAEEGIGFSNSKNIMYVSADGEELIIGSSSDGNVLIGSDHIDIRKSEKVLASFSTITKTDYDNAERNYTNVTSDDNLLLTTTKENSSNGESSRTEIKERASADNTSYTSSEIQIRTNAGLASEMINGSVAQIWMTSHFRKDVMESSEMEIYANDIHMGGDFVHIEALQRFTYDIPVVQAGDCNKLTSSGKYYLGNDSTNRPVNKNGWLESMLYSTDYCHQTYTTYTGERYTRMMQAGTWGAWVDESTTGWNFFWKTDNYNYWGYRKKCGIVEVAASSAGGWNIGPTEVTKDYTLPADCRPSIPIYGHGTRKDYTGYEIQYCIDTTGNIQICNLHPSQKTTYWGFSVTFIPG